MKVFNKNCNLTQALEEFLMHMAEAFSMSRTFELITEHKGNKPITLMVEEL